MTKSAGLYKETKITYNFLEFLLGFFLNCGTKFVAKIIPNCFHVAP